MDDKPPELAILLEKIHKIEEAMAVITNDLAKARQESHEREQARIKADLARLNAVPTSSALGNQFRRRDGDGFGTVPRKFGTTDPLDANHKTGDI